MPPQTILPYDRVKAVEYAHQWAYSRNPNFYNFDDIGGDCTNFASQCLYAGGGKMNFTPVFGWYYIDLSNRAPAWTGVKYFYNFITQNQETGPFGRQARMWDVKPGDFVQLMLDQDRFQHTPIIVSVGRFPTLDNILVAAHTDDCDYRPLSSYQIHGIRFLHIDGIRQ